MPAKRADFGKKDRLLSENSALMNAANMRYTRRADNEPPIWSISAGCSNPGQPDFNPAELHLNLWVFCPDLRSQR